MQSRYIFNPAKTSGLRVKSKDIQTPKIRAEFYVRLYSLLQFKPEITFEGYDFYIKDTVSGLTFNAGLSGFGAGYFSKEKSDDIEKIIIEFDEIVFNQNLRLVDCQIEYQHDFGKTVIGFSKGKIIELDFNEE